MLVFWKQVPRDKSDPKPLTSSKATFQFLLHPVLLLPSLLPTSCLSSFSSFPFGCTIRFSGPSFSSVFFLLPLFSVYTDLPRFLWEGHDNALQYSCPENLTDRGGWWATVHRVEKSWTRLSTQACVSSLASGALYLLFLLLGMLLAPPKSANCHSPFTSPSPHLSPLSWTLCSSRMM